MPETCAVRCAGRTTGRRTSRGRSRSAWRRWPGSRSSPSSVASWAASQSSACFCGGFFRTPFWKVWDLQNAHKGSQRQNDALNFGDCSSAAASKWRRWRSAWRSSSRTTSCQSELHAPAASTQQRCSFSGASAPRSRSLGPSHALAHTPLCAPPRAPRAASGPQARCPPPNWPAATNGRQSSALRATCRACAPGSRPRAAGGSRHARDGCPVAWHATKHFSS